MEAIILAGGYGTRLRQVLPNLPKSMAPIAGRPFLEILITTLAKKGITRIILSIGYMAEKITSYFGNEFEGIELIYEIENMPLGTGGAVRQAITQCKEDHVYVFNGDTYIDLEIQEVEIHWQENRRPIIVARRVEHTERYGRLDVAYGKVIGFSEKGISGPGLINAGCYIFPNNFLGHFLPGNTFSLERDFLAPMVRKHCFDCFVTKGHFIDIGIPEDYARAQSELKNVLH